MADIVGQDTILEGDLPDTAANYDSLAAFAAKTQQDWEDNLRDQEQTRWGTRVLGGLFSGLQQDRPFGAALIQALLKEIFDDNTSYGTVAGALAAAREKFRAKWDDIIAARKIGQDAQDDADTAIQIGQDAQDDADTAIEQAANNTTLVEQIIASGSNIIINSSFELLRFEQAGSQFSTNYKHSGSRSLKLTGTGSDTKSYVLLCEDATPRTVNVSPGDVFHAGYWVRGSDGTVPGVPANTQVSGGDNAVRMLFEPFDVDLQPLTAVAVSVDATTDFNDGWVWREDLVTMPEGARYLTITMQITDAVDDDQHWFFDDVSVREVSLASQALDNTYVLDDLAGEVLSAGSNLIINSSFENTRFEKAGSEFSTDYAHFGTRSLKLTGKGQKVSFNLQTPGLTPRLLSVSEGDRFQAEVWVRGSDGSVPGVPANTQVSGGADGIRMLFEMLGPLGALVSSTSIATSPGSALNAGWVKLSRNDIIIPPGVAKMRVSLELAETIENNQRIYFDDAVLREITVAAAASDKADTVKDQVDSVEELADEVVSSGSNLIVNPGFETDLFAQGAGVYSWSQARSGSRSLKLTRTVIRPNPKFYFLSDDTNTKFIPVAGGDTFFIQVWVKGDPDNEQTSGGEGGIKFVIEPYDRLTALDEKSISMTAHQGLSNDWYEMVGYVTMPPEATRMKMSVQLTSVVDNSESYYFDDAVCREVTLASTALEFSEDIVFSGSNLVVNPSFENGFFAPGAGTSFSDDYARTGSRSLKITANGNTRSYVLLSDGITPKTIPAQENDIFFAEVWIRGSSISQTVENGVKIRFEPTTRLGGNLIDQVVDMTVSADLNDTWTSMSGYVEMPPSTARVKMSIEVDEGVSSGILYFDDVVIRECTIAKTAKKIGETADTLATLTSVQNGIVTSPDFEESAVRRLAWASGALVGVTATYSTDMAKTGSQSLKLVLPAAGSSEDIAGVYLNPVKVGDEQALVRIPVSPGQVFTYDVFVRANASNTSSKQLGLVAHFFTVDYPDDEALWYASTAWDQVETDWDRQTGTFTIPATVQVPPGTDESEPVSMLLSFAFLNGAVGATGETVYLDRAYIYR